MVRYPKDNVSFYFINKGVYVYPDIHKREGRSDYNPGSIFYIHDYSCHAWIPIQDGSPVDKLEDFPYHHRDNGENIQKTPTQVL
jgi:hypothetical protein